MHREVHLGSVGWPSGEEGVQAQRNFGGVEVNKEAIAD